MIGDKLPAPDAVEVVERKVMAVGVNAISLSRKGRGERIQVVTLRQGNFNGTCVIWVHPLGEAGLHQGPVWKAAMAVIESGAELMVVEPFRTGAKAKDEPPPVNKAFAGYTFGYNRPLVSERVADILTAVAYARGLKDTKQIHLVGVGKAGPWVLLARGLCGDAVQRNRRGPEPLPLRAGQGRQRRDDAAGGAEVRRPAGAGGAVRAGELYLHNAEGIGTGQWLDAAYVAANAPRAWQRHDAKKDTAAVVQWLLR